MILNCLSPLRFIQDDMFDVVTIPKKIYDNGEFYIHSPPVCHQDVIILYDLYPAIHENIMRLLFIINAVLQGGAKTIFVIVPYLPYGRQDKAEEGKPLGTDIIGRLLSQSGLTRFMTFDMHSKSYEKAFTCALDHVSWINEYMKTIVSLYDHPVLVAPDTGMHERVKKLGQALKLDTAFITKKRHPHTVTALDFKGNVNNRISLIIDDMVDSGATLSMAATCLKQRGAKACHAFATHGLLTKGIDHLRSSLSSLTVSDTLPTSRSMVSDGFMKVDSVIPFIFKKLKDFSSC